ncbi:hypothetical protein HOD61_00630 [archaeon]|jgi:hypothetical protein|nr:hypothetical protein [archaeon]
MLNKLRDSIEKIKESNEFIDWKKDHNSSYITSAFLDKEVWSIHYYNSESDDMTTFRIENDVVTKENEKIFRKEKRKLTELKIEDIKIEYTNVEKTISNLIDEKYNGEESTKKIIILQQFDVPTWNITYVTSAMNVLNVKINAISGEIVEEKFENIMNLRG